MSKFCIGISDKQDEKQLLHLKEELQNSLLKYDLGIFYEFSYIEPFLENYIDKYFCFSISDNQYYDNCEMLLLPDKASINGNENHIPFKSRMIYIKSLLEIIMKNGSKVELFIGDSGAELFEFDIYTISLNNFLDFATDKLNRIVTSDLHLIINN